MEQKLQSLFRVDAGESLIKIAQEEWADKQFLIGKKIE